MSSITVEQAAKFLKGASKQPGKAAATPGEINESLTPEQFQKCCNSLVAQTPGLDFSSLFAEVLKIVGILNGPGKVWDKVQAIWALFTTVAPTPAVIGG